MAPKDDTFNHSGWWVACTERSRSVDGGWWMVDGGWWVVDGGWWMACDLREVVGVASPLAIVRQRVDSLHPLSS